MVESGFFAEQFQATTSQLLWTARQILEKRRFLRPPSPKAEWSAAREIVHLTLYEREVALPGTRLWRGGPAKESSRLPHEDEVWAAEGRELSYATPLQRLSDARAEQIALLPTQASHWDERRETVWGYPGLPPVTPRWVGAKTPQHSAEHVSALIKLTLFWDPAELRKQQAQASGGE
jgi:hypothetical protein